VSMTREQVRDQAQAWRIVHSCGGLVEVLALAAKLEAYAAGCAVAPLAVGAVVALLLQADLAPKARAARWLARRLRGGQ
jgi:hypothetical protein